MFSKPLSAHVNGIYKLSEHLEVVSFTNIVKDV